jgi:hypothetical protein
MTQLKKTRTSRGVFIVFFAIFMAVVLALLGLVLGLGMASVSSIQMQQLANLASLSALEGFFGSTGNTPQDKAAAAALRASTVLETNRLMGAAKSITNLSESRAIGLPWGTPGTVGTATFGAWYQEDPDDRPNAFPPVDGPLEPCGLAANAYPCFIPWTDSGITPGPGQVPDLINSVRISVRNDSTNPILAPFVGLFGQGPMQMGSQATAALVQRCTAYLLDVTLSSMISTHPLPLSNLPASTIPPNPGSKSNLFLSYGLTPPSPRLFAFRTKSLISTLNPPNTTIMPWNAYRTRCSIPDQSINWLVGAGGNPVNFESHIWCNTVFDKDTNSAPITASYRSPCTSEATCASQPGTFAQDYRDVDTLVGKMRVDMVRDPLPLSDFLLAFNAGLRLVRAQSTSGDGAVLIPFDGAVRSAYPIQGVTPNFDIMVQLTNASLRGRLRSLNWADTAQQWKGTESSASDFTSPVEPNFVSMGWFPVFADDPSSSFSQTHITNAISQAINRLQTFCPANAKKDIVIASDGFMSCSLSSLPNNCSSPISYLRFQEGAGELLANASAGSPLVKLLPILQQNRIAVTTLLAGSYVQPNFINKVRAGGGFVSLNQAGALGYGSNFFNSTNVVPPAISCGPLSPDECAYVNTGQPGVLFREPNSVFGQLAFRTGGLFCPLMPTCGDVAASDCPNCASAGYADCYDHTLTPPKLRDCARVADAPQTCSLTLESPGAQAARCVLESIGSNPYILVER